MNPPKTRRFRLCCAALLLLLCLIWGNSLLSGTTSGQISGGFSSWLGQFIPFLSPDSPNGHLFLRKAAHFSEFLLLGVTCTCLLRSIGKFHPLAALAACACTAGIDETIQLFVPGRCGALTDVLLDCTGAAVGVFGLTALLYIRRKKRSRSQV